MTSPLFPFRAPWRCAKAITGGRPVHPVGRRGPSPQSDKAAAKFLLSLDDGDAEVRDAGECEAHKAWRRWVNGGLPQGVFRRWSVREICRRCPYSPLRLRAEHTLAYATTVGVSGQPLLSGLSEMQGRQATTRGSA